MRVIGIVSHVNYNKDNQGIVQINDCLRRMSLYDDVVSILILLTMGELGKIFGGY